MKTAVTQPSLLNMFSTIQTCGGMARRKRTIDEEETEAADILEDVEASGELLVLRVPINNGM